MVQQIMDLKRIKKKVAFVASLQSSQHQWVDCESWYNNMSTYGV